MSAKRTAALLLSLVCCTHLAFAQSSDPTKDYLKQQTEKAKQDIKKAADDAKKSLDTTIQQQTGQPADQDPKAMMEMYAKAYAAGEHHKAMSPMVGHWDAEVWAQMDPSAPAMTSKGSSDNAWTMGDRIMKQSFKGSMMGMEFEGLGYIAYNSVTNKYDSIWMDSMAGVMTSSTGTASADGKTWTFEGTESDPMTKMTLKTKDVITITDNDHHTFTRSYVMPDAKEMKGLEIKYTRSAAKASLPATKVEGKPIAKPAAKPEATK